MGNFNDWSTTAASNASVGAMVWSEGQLPSTVNNSARQMAADIRYELGAISSTVSAGATVDIGSFPEGLIVLSGNATISSFGTTATTGLRKKIRVTGTPTIAHSVSGITVPGSANLTLAAGDMFEVVCESSGQYRVFNVSDADLTAIAGLSGVRGDIIYRDATQWQRLPKGTNGQVLTMGANDPAWGAGSTSAPTVQVFTSSAGTYTTPANCTAILVRAVAGGGGGAGAGASTAPAGSTGGTTTFNSVNAVGGTGGAANNGAGGAGGTGGTGTATLRVSGSAGGGGFANSGNGTNGCGGNAPFFAGGAPAVFTQTATGISGIANTGGGGAGAGGTSGVYGAGGGGGSGEYMEILIASPDASYSYAVGAAGAGGVGTGSGAATGGAGGAGRIIVTEYY